MRNENNQKIKKNDEEYNSKYKVLYYSIIANMSSVYCGYTLGFFKNYYNYIQGLNVSKNESKIEYYMVNFIHYNM